MPRSVRAAVSSTASLARVHAVETAGLREHHLATGGGVITCPLPSARAQRYGRSYLCMIEHRLSTCRGRWAPRRGPLLSTFRMALNLNCPWRTAPRGALLALVEPAVQRGQLRGAERAGEHLRFGRILASRTSRYQICFSKNESGNWDKVDERWYHATMRARAGEHCEAAHVEEVLLLRGHRHFAARSGSYGGLGLRARANSDTLILVVACIRRARARTAVPPRHACARGFTSPRDLVGEC
jgi:hypothetical protein